MWTFGPQHGVYFGIEADSNFWWWQFVWLSLLCMVSYFIDALLQFVPVAATLFYTSQNDYVQSFLNILYPLSQLYVGKEVKVTKQFLQLNEAIRKCKMTEPVGECATKTYLYEVKKQCKCVPYAARSLTQENKV